MTFPVWSRAISAQGTVKETIGDVNLPVAIAGQIVNPGDVVVADDDGVVIVPRARGAAVIAASKAREEKEANTRAQLAAGKLGARHLWHARQAQGQGPRYVGSATEVKGK